MKTNNGFDGRVFLTTPEWETYMRRMPVRYIRRGHADFCAICGRAGTKDNPLEHSHKIPFKAGVTRFHLTPDFLDSPNNIVSAHKRRCNKKAELSDEEIQKWLESQGHINPNC